MRIRSVLPSFWTDPLTGRLPDETKLLALALMTYSDDHGYFLADPLAIQGACFPFSGKFRENFGNISDGLQKLSEIGWIELRNNVEIGPVGHHPDWQKLQKVYHPNASSLKAYFDSETFTKTSRKFPETFGPEKGEGRREIYERKIESGGGV